MTALASRGNPLAVLLRRALGAGGQSFLAAGEQVLQKPTEQDAVVALLNVLSGYFSRVRHGDDPGQDVETIVRDAAAAAGREPPAQELLAALPALQPEVVAVYALARMDEAIVTPVFARSTASGSLMRRKIGPVIGPVLEQIAVLRHVRHG
ncbi:MAG: hypothetical protein MZV65_14805 [Chromatiales bacterium]|nr:hypothetical protein [Chromatiales bacterium]